MVKMLSKCRNFALESKSHWFFADSLIQTFVLDILFIIIKKVLVYEKDRGYY